MASAVLPRFIFVGDQNRVFEAYSQLPPLLCTPSGLHPIQSSEVLN